jgi:DNA-binding response OmpR family regulator
MRLLLVEDDPRIARDIERVLEANGYWWKPCAMARRLGFVAIPRITSG